MFYKIVFTKDMTDIDVVIDKNIDKNIFIPDIESILVILRFKSKLSLIQEIYNIVNTENVYELDYERIQWQNNIYKIFTPQIKLLNSYLNFYLQTRHSKIPNQYRLLNQIEKQISLLTGHFIICSNNNIYTSNIRYNRLLTNLSFVKLINVKLDTFEKRKKIFIRMFKKLEYHEVDMKAYFVQFLNYLFKQFNLNYKMNDYCDLTDILDDNSYSRDMLKRKIPQKVAAILKGEEYIDNTLGHTFNQLRTILIKKTNKFDAFDVIYNQIENTYKKFVYLKNLYLYKILYEYLLLKDNFFYPRDIILFGDSFGFLAKDKFNQIKELKLAHIIST